MIRKKWLRKERQEEKVSRWKWSLLPNVTEIESLDMDIRKLQMRRVIAMECDQFGGAHQ